MNPATLLVFAMTATLTASTPAWENLEPMPAPLGGQDCGAADGKLVVIGGTNWETGAQKNWVKTVYLFDPATLHWSLAGSMDQPHAYGIGATVDGAFLVVAGSTGSAPFDGVIRVKGGKLSWQPAGGVAVPAVLSAGGQIGDEIVLVGGSDDAANVKGLGREAHAWNIRTGKLRSLAPPPRAGFGIAASAVIGGDLFVFGGASWNEKTAGVDNTAEAWAFSSQRNEWRSIHRLPHPVRGTGAVALDDRHIYLGGGFGESGFTDQAFIYDAREDSYRPAPALPYPSSPHLVKSGDYLYCFGGEDRPKHRSDAACRIRTASLLRAP